MRASQVARGGMITGLSVALLYIASFLSVASWAACMLVAFIPALFFLVGESRTGMLVYAATSCLALFLLPDKSIAILYAGLFGLYTALKFWIERLRSRMIEWICKLTFANIWVLIVLKLISIGLIPELPALSPLVIGGVLLGGNLIFVYYDLCVSRIFAGMRGLARRFHEAEMKK